MGVPSSGDGFESGRVRGLWLAVLVYGALEAEMLAQSRPLIIGAEQAAPLKFRHDMIDELVE
jgi:hypothetical protein